MKPNIIYLLSDQHNQSVMGAAGDPWARTPNLDRLYARGTALDSCYCAAPLCVPSRSSILTGLLPTGNGVYNNMQCLPSDKATFVNSMTCLLYTSPLLEELLNPWKSCWRNTASMVIWEKSCLRCGWRQVNG